MTEHEAVSQSYQVRKEPKLMTVRTIEKDEGNTRQRILNVLVLLTGAGLEKDAMMTK